MKFRHLDVPGHWKHEWSKYPQGYTIMEALLNWVHQVDGMVTHINDWTDYLDKFVESFDVKLQGTVRDQLKIWVDDGTLADIIRDEVLTDFATLDDIDIDNKVFKKEIYKTLPINFPVYDDILAGAPTVEYFYPQAFSIDYEKKEIFVLFAPNFGGVHTQRWIVVYDYNTSEYKTCFGAGNAGGEGLVVKYEQGNRFLYVKETAQTIGRYLIDVFPAEKSVMTPQQTFNVGIDENFSYRNGTWLFEQTGATLGGERRRSSFSYYDDTFTQRGTFKISPFDGGLFNSDYASTTPKRQGIALGDNFIYQSTGGNFKAGDILKPHMYQGILKFNKSGELLESGLVDPKAYIDWYAEAGLQVDRIEQEGVFINPGGELISLTVHLGLNHASAHQQGITLVKEYSASRQKKDLSAKAKTPSKFNYLDIEGGVFPRSGDGKMYNPLTGDPLTTLADILYFLKQTDTRGFSFYTTSINVPDINGNMFPLSTLVRIFNANNGTFFIDCYKNPDRVSYCIYEAGDTYTQVRLASEPDSGWVNITTSLTPSASRPPRARRLGDNVHIEGMLSSLAGKIVLGQELGTITDPKLRPTKEQWFACYVQNNALVRVDIKTDGKIVIGSVPTGVATSEYLVLDGITYVGFYY